MTYARIQGKAIALDAMRERRAANANRPRVGVEGERVNHYCISCGCKTQSSPLGSEDEPSPLCSECREISALGWF